MAGAFGLQVALKRSAAAWRLRAIRARLSGKSRAGCSAPALVHFRSALVHAGGGLRNPESLVSAQSHYQAKDPARMPVGRTGQSYPAAMSTSPVSPEDIRAAAEVHAELGPEYSDAVVAAFIAEVDRQVAARVEARLVSTARTRPAENGGRGQLVKGMAIGVCAGALTVAGIGLAMPRASTGVAHSARAVPAHRGPIHAQLLPAYSRPGARVAILPRHSS
jgi:hypothetical protein